MDWFNTARYGLFIHRGVFSAAAKGEWFMNRELISPDEYMKYVEMFTAENYRPEEWAEYAKRWGMGYMVLTSRHHDGFALWDSKENSFNAVNYGPKKDLVKSYVNAVRNAGLKVGLYYSPASWTHPDYPGSCYRDWPQEKEWKSEECRRNFVKFYQAEIRELLTCYGKIDYLWFDGCIPENIDGDETVKIIKSIQPEILINNRLGNPYDVKVCEQTINPPQNKTLREACMTLNQNWGYHAGDHLWKQPGNVIDLIIQCARKEGNLLLNVGPTGDGTVPEESVRILDTVGEWVRASRRSIENTQSHGLTWNHHAKITRKGNEVYLHFLSDPGETFRWGDLATPVKRAYWLDTGEEVECIRDGKKLFFNGLKWKNPCRTMTVETDGEPRENYTQETFWIPE